MSTGQNIWESTATFLEKNGDVEVLIEHRLYGIVPAVVGLTIDRGIDEVLIES